MSEKAENVLSTIQSPLVPGNGANITRFKPMSVEEHKAHIGMIQRVMKEVMRPSTKGQADGHYGVIPGTDKPTLLKPGAEVILTTFRLGADPEIEDLSTKDEIRYRVRCRIFHQPSGMTLGWGVGEASTNEEKYKWRKAVSKNEFDATQPDRRRIKHYKNNGHAEQVRTEPADLANTVLKMAKKRAQVDATLTCTAASDMFVQDLEDMSPEVRESTLGERKPVSQPRKNGGSTETSQSGPLGKGALGVIRGNLARGGITETELCNAFEVGNIELIDAGRINEVLEWIKEHSA